MIFNYFDLSKYVLKVFFFLLYCFIEQEFQRSFGVKQFIYDGVNRMGRFMKDKSFELDRLEIEKKFSVMKVKWNFFCVKFVDR